MNQEQARRINAATAASMLTGVAGPATLNAASSISTQDIKAPRLQSVRIINAKNGYIVMPDGGYAGTIPFEDAYVAHDLDEVKDVLARYYVEKRLA